MVLGLRDEGASVIEIFLFFNLSIRVFIFPPLRWIELLVVWMVCISPLFLLWWAFGRDLYLCVYLFSPFASALVYPFLIT